MPGACPPPVAGAQRAHRPPSKDTKEHRRCTAPRPPTRASPARGGDGGGGEEATVLTLVDAARARARRLPEDVGTPTRGLRVAALPYATTARGRGVCDGEGTRPCPQTASLQVGPQPPRQEPHTSLRTDPSTAVPFPGWERRHCAGRKGNCSTRLVPEPVLEPRRRRKPLDIEHVGSDHDTLDPWIRSRLAAPESSMRGDG
jgi:hypothetical protein